MNQTHFEEDDVVFGTYCGINDFPTPYVEQTAWILRHCNITDEMVAHREPRITVHGNLVQVDLDPIDSQLTKRGDAAYRALVREYIDAKLIKGGASWSQSFMHAKIKNGHANAFVDAVKEILADPSNLKRYNHYYIQCREVDEAPW